jgi:GT2 family glycosyltransferase
MVNSQPVVTVIICAYTEDRWEDLVAAVRSIQAQTVPAGETLIVIDHCPSLLERASRSLPGLCPTARLRIVANTGRQGLSGARNTGVSRARTSIVAFLDDDAQAAPDWLERLTFAYHDPTVIGVGGQVIPAWQDHRPGWFPPEFDWVVGCTHRGVRTDAGPIRNFVGANMSFRRATVSRVGGFRSDLGRVGTVPLGCEETELCIRATRDNQGVLLYEPAAQVRHTVPQTRTTWRYFRSRCYAEGLSKAAVSRLTGREAALQTERSYVLRALPRGIASSIKQALTGRPSGATRAAAIVAGTAITGLGYLAGCRAQRQPIHAAPRVSPKASRWTVVVSMGLIAAAIALWLSALTQHVALGNMTDLGLMTVLPVTFWLGLAAVTLAFTVAVTNQPRATWLLPACVLTLLAMLHATPTILYGTLRYSWAWKHIAVIDYIQRHGRLDLSLDQLSAYQAWPGFFALSAVFNAAGGVVSSLSYASWGPPVFEIAFLGPLLLIFRQFTTDRRLIWTGVWFFYLGNWIGQDYFSPQAFAYFLYLVVIAVILRRVLKRPQPAAHAAVTGPVQDWGEPPSAHGSTTPRAVIALLLLPIAAIATTHQLTPLMLVSAFGFLWLFRQRLPRRVLILTAAITVGWILIAARSFLSSNLYWIIQSIGHPDANTTSTLVNLSKVTPGQVLVADIDRLLSACLWVLAAIGCWRRRGRRKADRPFLLLALAPLPLIVSNNYGGEMLFRVYFFALPFVAIFAASALFPSPSKGRSRWTSLTATVIAAILLSGFCYSYYGKEQINYFSPDEVAAGKWVYSHAPTGSLLVSATSNWPYSFQHFEDYQYDWFALDSASLRRQVMSDPVSELATIMSPARHNRAYVIFTPSQSAEVAGLGLLPPGEVDRIEATLLASPRFRVVYRNPNAVVLTLAGGGTRP